MRGCRSQTCCAAVLRHEAMLHPHEAMVHHRLAGQSSLIHSPPLPQSSTHRLRMLSMAFRMTPEFMTKHTEASELSQLTLNDFSPGGIFVEIPISINSTVIVEAFIVG